jgi:hypothetical protein
VLDLWNRGSGRGEEPGGAKGLHLIQIRLATLSLGKIAPACQTNLPRRRWPLEVPKRRQYFIRAHDETLSVVAMSACNQYQNAMAHNALKVVLTA